MQSSLLRKIWNDNDETKIQDCIEEVYSNKGYDVKNFHQSDRRNEDGIDLLCKMDNEKIGFAVKIKPGKKDIDQLERFLSNKGIKKIYVYVDHPAKPFEKEIEKHKSEIEFWDWDKLHDELVLAPSTQYLIRYILQNPLVKNLSDVHYSLYKCRKAKYQNHKISSDELSDLWNIKDDAVKLRAILDHINRRWGEILMDKTEFDNKEYRSTLDTIFHELEIANEICGIKLKDSFKKFEEHYPNLLGLFWTSVGVRSHWRTFTHTLNCPIPEPEVKQFIRYTWLMPNHKDHIMNGFDSSLSYILLRLFEVSENVEDVIDSIFSNVSETYVLNREPAFFM